MRRDPYTPTGAQMHSSPRPAWLIDPYASSGQAEYTSQGFMVPRAYDAATYSTLGSVDDPYSPTGAQMHSIPRPAWLIDPYASSGQAEYTSQGFVVPRAYDAATYSTLGNTPYADDLVFDGNPDTALLGVSGEGGCAPALGDLDAGKVEAAPASFKAELKAVIEAAMEPGTEKNRQVGLRLLDKADQLAALMEKRAVATEKLREGYRQQARIAEAKDAATLHAIHTNLRPGAEPSKQAILKIAAERKGAFDAAKKGVRLQKANIVGSALTANAAAQVSLLQRMAMAVAQGQPSMAAVYGGMYDKLARTSDGLKQMRREQLVGDKAAGLAGLSAVDPNLADLMDADDVEAELAALAFVELSFLEGFAHTGPEDEDALGDLGARVGTRFKRRVQRASKRVAKRVKMASRKVKNLKVVKNAIKVAKPLANAVKHAVKATIIAPVKSTVVAARAVAHGERVGKAFKSGARVMKQAAKDLGKSVGSLTVGFACALEDTRLGRAAAQYAGQAAGTIYGGGTVGGAVGKEVGRKVNEMNRTGCKGLEKAGLTGEGNFKGMRNARREMRKAAQDLRKNVFSKEAMKQSAMRIAGGMLGGGASPVKIPGTDKLLSVAKDKALEAAKRRVTAEGRRIAKKVGVNLSKKVLGQKAARAIDRASNYARLAVGQGGADAARQIARDLGPVAGQKLLTRAGMNPRIANQITGASQALAAARQGKALKLDAKTTSALVKRFGPAAAQQLAIRAGVSPATSKALIQVAQRAPGLSKAQLNKALVQQMLRNRAASYGQRAAHRAGLVA